MTKIVTINSRVSCKLLILLSFSLCVFHVNFIRKVCFSYYEKSQKMTIKSEPPIIQWAVNYQVPTSLGLPVHFPLWPLQQITKTDIKSAPSNVKWDANCPLPTSLDLLAFHVDGIRKLRYYKRKKLEFSPTSHQSEILHTMMVSVYICYYSTAIERQ